MNRDDDVFADALEIPEAERAAFLDRVCAGDPEKRARVEALLRGHGRAPAYFDAPSASSPSVEKPGDRIDRYRLLERIGEGGCGVVWLAEQTEPVHRRVALKVIRLGMDTKEVIARFEAERQALALMDHPNIAKVLDAGTTATGRPYFVMELVRGIPITRYCDDANLPTAARLQLFIPICHAVQHAHQKGIIHRDLKPSNILVTRQDDGAVPKVIDFGIAKATQGRITDATVYTSFAQLIGTPAYMSPEQAAFGGLDIDTRSDIYSLGVLLYELLTGQPPFDPKALVAGGLDEIRRVIREVEPPRPSTRLNTLTDADRTTLAQHHGTAPAQLSTELSGDLDWIVMKALEKDRARRYETANGFAMDLQRHLSHEPVVARPPSATYLLQKLIRRHRVAFGTAAAIASVLMLGVLVSAWLAIRATRAEHEQSRLRETAQRRAYAGDLNGVQQALADGNLGRARQLLYRQRPQSGEADLRDWEWRYLWQFCRSDAKSVLAKGPGWFNSVAAAPDGKWLATAPTPIALWDLQAGISEKIPMPGFDVSQVAFSPREPLLAMAGFRESPSRVTKVMLWNFVTRQTVNEWTISSTGDSCTGLFFSEDGQTLVTSKASNKNEIGLRRVATGELLRSVPTAPSAGQQRSAFFAVSFDLKLAAYISRGDYHVHVLDLVTGRELWSKPAGAEGAVALSFSPDGKILASGDRGQESPIRLWEAGSGIELGRLEGNRRSVTQLVFWPDGKTLASSGADQTVHVWDVESRRLKRILRGHSTEVLCLALLDNKTLVSGSKNGELLLWDTTTVEPATRPVTVIPGEFMGWRFSDTGGSIITVEHDGRIAERRGENYREAKTLLQLGSTIWAADIEARVIVVDGGWPRSETGSTILARDRSRLAHVSANGNIEVWDWERGRRVSVIAVNDSSERLAPLSFADKGEKLLLSRFVPPTGVTREEWDVAGGRQTRSWKATADPPALAAVVVLSPDEKRLMAIASPTTLVCTELASSGETRLELDVRNAPQLGSFSPDSSLFAVPTWNGLVQVVNVDPLRSVETLSGFFGGIYSAAFSPNGRRLATGSGGDEAMTLWEVGNYERLLTIKAAGSQIRQAAFSPDGSVLGALVGIPPKSSLHLWRAPSWAEIEKAEVLAAPKP